MNRFNTTQETKFDRRGLLMEDVGAIPTTFSELAMLIAMM
jgi:hypothetical protein